MHALFALDGAEVRLEHHVEVARLGPLADGAAIGATDDIHRDVVRVVELLLLRVRLLQVILTVTLVTVEALDERVVEDTDVTGRDPHLAGQDHRRVEADDVLAAGDHVAPPLALDVLLELDTQWAVVPCGLGTAVDLTARVDQASPLGEIDNGFDLGLGCHSIALHLGNRCMIFVRFSHHQPIWRLPRTSVQG